jgi:hypothetical protein
MKVTNEQAVGRDVARNFRQLNEEINARTPACRARRTAVFSLANNTNHTILWDAESYDTDGFHSTSSNTSRLTVPAGKGGLYSAGFSVDVATGANVTSAWIVVNGGTTRFAWVQTPNLSQGVFMQGSDFLALNSGDYVETMVYQNSGGALNSTSVNASFWLHRVGNL